MPLAKIKATLKPEHRALPAPPGIESWSKNHVHIDDKRYLKKLLKQLKPLDPAALWSDFASRDDLPPITFSLEASAVYSSNIEGNTIDLDSFMNSKLDRKSRAFKAKERKEIEALVEAYQFAGKHALSEKNLLKAHSILAKPLLPKAHHGKYREQLMFVYSQHGSSMPPSNRSSSRKRCKRCSKT